ncbi:putative ParM [Brevibacillus phage SecTim467]|uniref:Putative ParM n=2 Tax=Jenstvirus jenst TaxID=1982225 RepID=A0A0K2CP54_9CAUD|nr:partition protein [Brevibacillus phage Jenst]ALA07136.1 putative ParM [Brevibacillus phage Jenst]ALA07508.1 putative ParM [Brevibacillus phage SecTim467]
MVLRELVWAMDDGFGDDKGFDGEETLLVPNYIKPVGRIYTDDETSDISPDERIIAEVHEKIKQPRIKFEDAEGEFPADQYRTEKYIVGIGALEKEKGSDWNGSLEFKHMDVDFKPYLSTCLCLMAERYPEEIEVDLLVMGLPVDEHEKGDRKTFLKSLAVGTHHVTITKGNEEPFTRIVHVKDVLIYKQPMGTVYFYVFDDMGKFKKDSIAEDFNVVSDIGARTHNVYACKEMRKEDDYLGSSESGIYSAYEFVRDQLANMDIKVTVAQLVARLETKEINGYDFAPLLDKAYQRLASTIIKELTTKIQQSKDTINRIIFTGGGSEVLKEYLLPLAKAVFKKQEIIWGDRFTTVKGYRNAGVRAILNKKKSPRQITAVGAKITNKRDEV